MGVKINGAELKRLRKALGMTEVEVARKAGISVFTYLKIENSEAYNSQMNILGKLSLALCRNSYRNEGGEWAGFTWDEYVRNIRALIIEERNNFSGEEKING